MRKERRENEPNSSRRRELLTVAFWTAAAFQFELVLNDLLHGDLVELSVEVEVKDQEETRVAVAGHRRSILVAGIEPVRIVLVRLLLKAGLIETEVDELKFRSTRNEIHHLLVLVPLTRIDTSRKSQQQ